ncbi:MAG: hypothetical protein JOZ22_15830 [Acidobacteriia bacterium]|nr:hypothetical protein [Terriglobia bacterium]
MTESPAVFTLRAWRWFPSRRSARPNWTNTPDGRPRPAAALDDVLAAYFEEEQQDYNETADAVQAAYEEVKAGRTDWGGGRAVIPARPAWLCPGLAVDVLW